MCAEGTTQISEIPLPSVTVSDGVFRVLFKDCPSHSVPLTPEASLLETESGEVVGVVVSGKKRQISREEYEDSFR